MPMRRCWQPHGAAARIERDDEDVFLSYTGGTTGLPKGVLVRMGHSAGNSLWFRDLFLESTTDMSPVEYAVALGDRGISLSAIPASPLMHSTGFILASLPTLRRGPPSRHCRDDRSTPTSCSPRSAHTSVIGIVGDAFGLPIVRALDEGAPDGRPYTHRR